jgi:hypothetical protein
MRTRTWILLILLIALVALTLLWRLQSDRDMPHQWPDDGHMMPPP